MIHPGKSRLIAKAILISLILAGCSPISPTYSLIQNADAIPPAITDHPAITQDPPIIIEQPTIELAPHAEPTIGETPSMVPTSNFLICSQAPIGQNVTCMIESASCSYQANLKGSPTFCNDAPYPTNNFTFLAWGEDLSQYDGNCLVVTGSVQLYKGKPEIVGTGSSITPCE